MFLPLRLVHGQKLKWKLVTHVRLIGGRSADTAAAQQCLDHIRHVADEAGVASIDSLRPGWPHERHNHDDEVDMRHSLRHFANPRSAGTRHENKGLIEVGYLDPNRTSSKPYASQNAKYHNASLLMDRAKAVRGGGGEGEAHRALKLKAAANPEWFGIDWPCTVEVERKLPSGDSIDVMFLGESVDVAVEIKPPGDAVGDLVRGVFQCIKYEAVLAAEAKVDGTQRETRVVLATGSFLPADISSLAKKLQVSFVEGLVSKG